MRFRVSDRITIGGLAALACLLGAVSVARADDYPSRVVTLVVPYPPGGGVDARRAWWRRNCPMPSISK